MKKDYYDGTKLLSLKDINGGKPEIYIVTNNRTAGKTTYFNRLMVNRFLKKGEKFALLYRYVYEIDDVAEKFFKDIQGLFFPEYVMTSKVGGNGCFRYLYLNEEHCGYAIALNSADQIKKHSHLFSDVKSILFDEFQSESGEYCPKELRKFQSIHLSIARGQGQRNRYVPVYMLGNPVSLLNPYYVALGISSKIQGDTRFMRGDGWVMEQGYEEVAARAQEESPFNRAFQGSQYQAYAQQAIYLNDNATFIERPKGRARYVCNLKYNDDVFSVKEFAELGLLYIDTSIDKQCPINISLTLKDHTPNYVMMHRSLPIIMMIKTYFDRGCVRFRNLAAKECIFALVSNRT